MRWGGGRILALGMRPKWGWGDGVVGSEIEHYGDIEEVPAGCLCGSRLDSAWLKRLP